MIFSRLLFPTLIFVLFASGLRGQTNAIVDLPMRMNGSMPAVEVMVNGKGPFIFSIDTGASGKARIDSSLAKKLGLEVSGQAQAGDGSGQNTKTIDLVKIDTLKIGSLEFTNIEALSRDYNAMARGLPPIDGIIGFGLFADHLLTLDFPGKRVLVFDGSSKPLKGSNMIGLDSTRGIATIDIDVGNQRVKAHLDSGNMVAPFVLPTAVVEKAKLASEPVVVGRARTISNDIEIKRVKLNETIRIGNMEFIEPTVSYPALSEANIGSALMQDLILTFDQKHKLLNIERPLRSSRPLAANPTPGEYAGKYGERVITEEESGLFIQRTGGPRLKLRASEIKDEFTLEQIPAARIKFIRDADGKITAVEVLNPAGNWERGERDGQSAKTPAAKLIGRAGVEFILVPAGEFVMGSNTSAEDQRPPHSVKITRRSISGNTR